MITLDNLEYLQRELRSAALRHAPVKDMLLLCDAIAYLKERLP